MLQLVLVIYSIPCFSLNVHAAQKSSDMSGNAYQQTHSALQKQQRPKQCLACCGLEPGPEPNGGPSPNDCHARQDQMEAEETFKGLALNGPAPSQQAGGGCR